MHKVMGPNYKMIKVCDKIKKTMKELEDYGTNDDLRGFSYFDIHGNKISNYLNRDDKLHPKLHCPRCGVRIVIRNSDPHNVLECISCGYHIDPYSMVGIKNELIEANRQLFNLLDKVNDLKNLILTMERKNNVIEKNLKNKAME